MNIIKPNQKAPDMHNRSKQYSTIYIDNQPIDLEKGRYVWEDKETDKRMSVLCMDYIRLFHEKNSDAHISDGQLRNRFYNLFKNWYPDEYKIRELGPDTR